VNASPYSGPHITRAEQPGGIIPAVHSVLAVYFFKGTTTPRINREDGVSTYLALTFGTLLSSQGTDASFGIPSRISSGRFPSVFRVSDSTRSLSVSDSPSEGALLAFPAFSLGRSGDSDSSPFTGRLIIESAR
jgi:hypothetical protein